MEIKAGLEIQRKSGFSSISNSTTIKAGLEIHQQLDTNKLFCECPSILRNDEPEFKIMRKLHAVAGESGEIDIAAKHEAEQEKEFIYEGYDTTCLVELDEEPPHEINKEALKIALHIALHLNCEILPATQIMRKTVIDGSNTGGFQRTVLIARNGWIETENGKVRIDNVSLEEDAARIVNKEKGKTIFRLDRLGIPLVEIGTAPDIKTPEQAKEAALLIGDILRSCKVKRGIGTIRQDVNISTEGHPRIEIKGFQDVKMFIPVIENEIKRQRENLRKFMEFSGSSKSERKKDLEDIKNKKELKSEVRNALPNGKTEFLRPMPGSARMYPETDLPLLKISRQIINEAKETLPKLRDDVRKELGKKGLSEEQAKILLKEDKLEEFESLLKIINEPKFIFKSLIELPKEIASHEKIENIDDKLSLDIIEEIINAVNKKKIERADIKHIMEEIARGKNFEEAIKIEKADTSSIETEVAKLIKEKPGLSTGGYMGLIMQKFKGKINGKEANDILQKLLK